MYGLNKTTTYGLEDFKKLLDERQQPEKRTKGLLTGRPTLRGTILLL